MNLFASGLGSGGLGAERTLLLAAAAELTTQGVGVGEGFANALEVLLCHSAPPPRLDTSTARVVGKADKSSVLVGIQVLGIGHGTNAALILGNVFLE
jgi:hypothetical protein